MKRTLNLNELMPKKRITKVLCARVDQSLRQQFDVVRKKNGHSVVDALEALMKLYIDNYGGKS